MPLGYLFCSDEQRKEAKMDDSNKVFTIYDAGWLYAHALGEDDRQGLEDLADVLDGDNCFLGPPTIECATKHAHVVFSPIKVADDGRPIPPNVATTTRETSRQKLAEEGLSEEATVEEVAAFFTRRCNGNPEQWFDHPTWCPIARPSLAPVSIGGNIPNPERTCQDYHHPKRHFKWLDLNKVSRGCVYHISREGTLWAFDRIWDKTEGEISDGRKNVDHWICAAIPDCGLLPS